MNAQLRRLEILRNTIDARTATVGVCGLGYVGLPLALAASGAGYHVIGFDIDEDKVGQINRGNSYLGTVAAHTIDDAVKNKRLEASTDFARLASCDVIIVCVPTPLTRHREPDLSFVEKTTSAISRALRPGQLVVLESTTYPGTTNEMVKPLLQSNGLISGRDFFLGFSPEREDPGNLHFDTVTIPKVVSGDGPIARELMVRFYETIVKTVVSVSTNDTAEAVKITENVFRAVNIALVNELKLIYDAMGIDIWEVIEAAKTKPFGFMPFYPGPGLGGHCIPIDPFYLTWKAREHGVPTRFIELAGEINTAMPRHVVARVEEELDRRRSKTLSSARILLIGVAYKKNVSDTRESPALTLIDMLEKRGAKTIFHDPHVDVIPATREHAPLAGRRSVALDRATLEAVDLVLIVTDHDAVDYALLEAAPLIVDTRNACASRGLRFDHVVKA